VPSLPFPPGKYRGLGVPQAPPDLPVLHMLLQLTGAIGQLSSLKDLELKNLGALRSLPEALGALGNLRSLYIGYCMKLEELPGELQGTLRPSKASLLRPVTELAVAGPVPGLAGEAGQVENSVLCPAAGAASGHWGDGGAGASRAQGLDSLRALPESLGFLSHLQPVGESTTARRFLSCPKGRAA